MSEAVVGVAGAGAWGTALALAAARAGNRVRLWARDPATLARLSLDPGVETNPDIGALAATDPLLLVVPAQAVREVCRRLRDYRGSLVVCAKGLERASGLKLSQVVREELPGAVPATRRCSASRRRCWLRPTP